MRYKKRIIIVFLCICVLWGISIIAKRASSNLNLLCITEATEPTILFRNNSYAVGQALEVEAIGYPWGTKFSYEWFVDGHKIHNTSDVYILTENDLQKFISVKVTPEQGGETKTIKMYFSCLPVFYIDTDDGDAIDSKNRYKTGALKVQGNAMHSRSNVLYEGQIQIKGRGNSTWNNSGKPPYHLKLMEDGNLLGIGKENDWTLLANDFDVSLMRNAIAYDLSEKMGLVALETTWIDMVINGEYVGNYLLCEKLEVAEERVDITNWEKIATNIAELMLKECKVPAEKEESLKAQLKTDLSWITTGEFLFEDVTYQLPYSADLPELTGGVLMELDMYYDEVSKFTVENQHFMFNEPMYANTNSELYSYVKEYVAAFYYSTWEKYSDDYIVEYQGEEMHYSDFFDMDSLVTFWLIQEIFFNEDAHGMSTFFYKDVEEIAYMGPVWDMDRGSGGHGTASHLYDEWQTEYFANYDQVDQFYKGLVLDPYFLSQVIKAWDLWKEELFALVKDNGTIDQPYDYIYTSGVADSVLWDGENRFDSGVEVFKTWMTNRLKWMDEQFESLEILTESIGRFDYGVRSQLTRVGDTIEIRCETAEALNVSVYLNGRLQDMIRIENGVTTWAIPEGAFSECEADVVQIRLYNNLGEQIANNYMDNRK